MRVNVPHSGSRTPPVTLSRHPGESVLVYLDRIMFATQTDLSDADLLARLREVRDIDRDVAIATEKEVDKLDRPRA